MDSDDQNANKKCDIDEVLVEYKVDTKCCDKIDGSQYLDANGNRVNGSSQRASNERVECDCLGVEIDAQIKSTISESNTSHQLDENIMKKLQKMTLSDDDYGELGFVFFLSSTYQLARLEWLKSNRTKSLPLHASRSKLDLLTLFPELWFIRFPSKVSRDFFRISIAVLTQISETFTVP